MGKPLGFLVVGVSGAIVTLILVAAMFAPTGTRRQTPTGRNNVVTSDAIARRVAAAGGQSGDVQISLAWSNYNDLDLWVVHDGEKIFFGHPREAFGRGSLDVDMNVSPETNRPCENIFWPRGSSPRGDFEVYVDHFRRHGRADPTPYMVRVLKEGRVQVFRGAIRHGERAHLVTRFTLAGGPVWRRRDLMPLAVALLLAFWIGYVVVGIRLFRATPGVQHTGEVVGAGTVSMLEAIAGPHMGEAFPLVARCLHVGRGAECAITLSRDEMVSRHHATLLRDRTGWRIEDNASSNGLYINGERASVRYVHAGDLIEVGRTVLRAKQEAR